MNIRRYLRKRAISPVLATVILIAITLVAAVAIATFVFGLFGTSVSGPTLSITSSSISCIYEHCTMTVHNSGASSGSVTGVGPGTFTSVAMTGGCASLPCAVPANGDAQINMTYIATGQQATGYLTQSNGPNLVFSVVLS